MHNHHHFADSAHAHAHSHAHGSHRSLLWALGLTLSFAFIEAVAGWWSGSLALLGDAGHMLTDSLALGLAAAAAILARSAPSIRHSYGLGRIEILAALLNALIMIVLVALISAEAADRLSNSHPVKGAAVVAIAIIGLLVNLAAAWLLTGGGKEDLNVRAALLHVLGDLLGSVAALISGAVILLTGWTMIDPLLSLAIVFLILVSALRILREAWHALMEGVPKHLNLEKIGYAMASVDGVVSVHDLHIWSLSASRIALSAHIVVKELGHWPEVLSRLQQRLSHEFGIDHVTLQPETYGQSVAVSALTRKTATERRF